MSSIRIILGERAKAHIANQGLKPEDICAIPAAAGGPKGLILQGLDHYLFTNWLGPAHLQTRKTKGLLPLQLIGASIGAWRMAAAASSNPAATLKRLAQQYVEAQNYKPGVDRFEISRVCEAMVQTVVADEAQHMVNPTGKELLVWVNKGLTPLHHARQQRARKRGFASAVLANSMGRNRLANYFERWVFQSPGAHTDWLAQPFDRIPTRIEDLDALNIHSALLASGSIPFVLNPVNKIVKAFESQTEHHPRLDLQHHHGPFWDGGLTDYHLALPYHRLPGLVLYPHFAPTVTPGWLDKFLKLRKAKPEWMSNVILVCPSPEFVASLPARKIPDRSDFKRYKFDHTVRIPLWQQAIAESERMAEDFNRWLHTINGQ
ncbi:MAG TPA: patatin-like phospholipase family protein [Limnobacter sp.]|nr:patatin-like phospholipase family protein [Limnobacter sp.]